MRQFHSPTIEEQPGEQMAAAEGNQNPGNEPELHLLLADTFEPLWKSLFHDVEEFFFPEKLPPLKLESQAIPVRDIWGFYNYRKNGALGSTVAHVFVLGMIIGTTFITVRRPVPVVPKPQVTRLIDPGDYLLKPAKTEAGGGGGGGDGDVLQASVGRLPKSSMQQITPPAAVIRNPNPKLPVEPTVIVPPDIKMAMNDMPNLGDPKSSAVIPSNGPGAKGGIGDGSDGGVGPGHGHGVGPGDVAGTGDGTFRMGKGMTPPRVIYQTDPEFSEEARKAKYQGNCVLGLVVDANGRPINIRVLSALGMGLDEKAIESVKNWKFEPGKRNGQNVAVEIAVEVDFHLY
jgi:protein TonB